MKHVEEFESWFLHLMTSCESCFHRDVLRGNKKNLYLEFCRLADGGEATLQSIFER